jgi:enoyl-CoA hydratase/carnithine racemase
MELSAGCVRLPRALDEATVATLANGLEQAMRAEGRVVTLIGHDDETFCAGVAVDAVLQERQALSAFVNLLMLLRSSPKPLLALVDGRALGGGLGLACACDWVVASARATFGLPELLWGLAPAIIWPVVTARLTPSIAWQWTISAHARTASDAKTAGVVDELVEADELDRHGRRAARLLERLEPEALRRLRQWSRESQTLALPAALARGAAITTELAGRPTVTQRWDAYSRGEAPWSA